MAGFYHPESESSALTLFWIDSTLKTAKTLHFDPLTKHTTRAAHSPQDLRQPVPSADKEPFRQYIDKKPLQTHTGFDLPKRSGHDAAIFTEQTINTMQNKTIETFLVDVLGCKVNQYDARQIEELLSGSGLGQAETPETADLIIIHTCGVTAAAAQKSRQAIRRMQRKNPAALIAVTGCAAKDELTGIDDDSVIRVPAGKEWLQNLAHQLEHIALPVAPAEFRTDETTISGFGAHTRAFLKIQDGCDIGCSYCIVPSLRKAPRDKPLEAAVREAETLTKNGYREIVITGVSVGLYGKESGDSLAEVLRRISRIPDIGRIRMSSLHPSELTEELLEVWAGSPNIMPHLHLSLQSGSDRILKVMRRNYTTAEFLAAVERARTALNTPAFTTDVITGFPGETDKDFEQTLSFCREVGFSRIHTFCYSPRPGTAAAIMKNQINGSIAAARSEKLRETAAELSLNYHQQFIGKTVEVLIEETGADICEGLSEHYVPVQLPSESNLKGKVVSAVIQDASAKGITGIKKAFNDIN